MSAQPSGTGGRPENDGRGGLELDKLTRQMWDNVTMPIIYTQTNPNTLAHDSRDLKFDYSPPLES